MLPSNFPMNVRTSTCITALGLSHLFLALPLLTSQLLPRLPVEITSSSRTIEAPVSRQQAVAPLPLTLFDSGLGEPITISARTQEKKGEVYTLTGDALIEFRDVKLSADHIVYDRLSGEITAEGNLVMD